MYNYENLSDVEFEELCKDIMSMRLNKELRTFTKGRDSGIDICDSITEPTIVIQAKHYFRSTFSDLKRSLEGEVSKLEKLGAKNYYICTSKGLTPNNVGELYAMFSNYMDDEHHILGKNDIDSILDGNSGNEILLRHYKLWLTSNLMAEVLHGDAIVDCEVLMMEIDDKKRFFVPTKAYSMVLEKLHEKRLVILIGNPGCGKTMTSMMAVLYYSKKGYRIIYISDHNIKEAKALLSRDPNKKEIIYLDDCFGQRYFEMKSDTGKELESLIKYISFHPNKCLLMNSRISIFQEAKNNYLELEEEVNKGTANIVTINMEEITTIEKAKILYNHIYFNHLPERYMDSIKNQFGYRKIVEHPNYFPRLISRLTTKHVVESTTADTYLEYVMQKLDNPDWIWKDEYNNRLQNVDRLFMNTLYSLTDNMISIDIHRRAYNRRVFNENIDTSSAPWESAKNRLVNNMLKIIIKDNKEMLAVANPSVNDYLDAYIKENSEEVDKILNSATEYCQIVRLRPTFIDDKVRDGSVLKLNFSSSIEMRTVILEKITELDIFLSDYCEIVEDFFTYPDKYTFWSDFIVMAKAYLILLKPDLDRAYNTKVLVSKDRIRLLLENAVLTDFKDFFNLVEEYGKGDFLVTFADEIKNAINDAIIGYIEAATVEDYYQENINQLLYEYTSMEDNSYVIDSISAGREVANNVEDVLYDELYGCIERFPEPFNHIDSILDMISKYINIDAESFVESAFQKSDIDEDLLYEQYRECRDPIASSMDEVDRIFR